MQLPTASFAVLLGMSLFGFAKKADPDQMVLEQLKKAGSDLAKPHKIEFFLYFPTQAAANNASLRIKAKGFQVEVKQAATGPAWLCFATRAMAPQLKEMQQIRKDFTAIALADGGDYDGWGTEIVP
jgi:hypothetical protein